LALALGMTVRQLLKQTTSAELNEWRAFYSLEPFGDLIADQRHGIAQSLSANLQRDAKRTPQPYTPEDFIPWHETHRKADKATQGKLLSNPKAQSSLIKSLFQKKH
jgi:hypothetical protein